MSKNVMPVWGLLLALLIVAPPQVDAQARITLSAGKTSASLEGQTRGLFAPFGEAAVHDNQTGFFAGASLSVPLGGILSVSPGLYFVQKGSSFENEELGTIQGSLELSYIEVPVTLGVAVTSSDFPLGVRLFAGPEIAFEVDCDLDISPATDTLFVRYDPFPDCRWDDVDESERKSIDLGLVFGADVSYGPFFVRGGLDMGLTSLDDDRDLKNSAWFLGAGIVIGG